MLRRNSQQDINHHRGQGEPHKNSAQLLGMYFFSLQEGVAVLALVSQSQSRPPVGFYNFPPPWQTMPDPTNAIPHDAIAELFLQRQCFSCTSYVGMHVHTFLVLYERQAACIRVAAEHLVAKTSSSVCSLSRRCLAISDVFLAHANITALRTCVQQRAVGKHIQVGHK